MKDHSIRFTKLSFCALLASLLATLALVGCSQSTPEPDPDAPFSYSLGIDDKGYWAGIKASDYVELPDNYTEIEAPKEISVVNENDIQSEIDYRLSSFSTQSQITDRPVADGDTLNIDYVGSIDGVAFEGGSTNGTGTEVTIGKTSYIDDFLEQLIGHNPGETFDIEVTFPADYGKEDLNGRDAIFNITINSIIETSTPELTDEFVATNLKESEGWNTVEEMKASISDSIEKRALQTYLDSYLVDNSNVKSVPDSLISYQEKGLISYYQEYADNYGMSLEEFISSQLNASSTEELLEKNAESLKETAVHSLIIQALAEKQNITASDTDVLDFFVTQTKTDDYSNYESEYGMPYLKQIALGQMVSDFLVEHAHIAS